MSERIRSEMNMLGPSIGAIVSARVSGRTWDVSMCSQEALNLRFDSGCRGDGLKDTHHLLIVAQQLFHHEQDVLEVLGESL